MFGTRCPACGAPTPVALFDEHCRCVHCGTVSPLPDAARANLGAARSLLSSLDVRHRQLTATEQRALAWERRLRVGFVLVFGLLTFAFASLLGLFLLGMIVGEHHLSFFAVVWAVVPAVAVVGIFVLLARTYLRRLDRGRLALENACAALPPERPGEPSNCHVCGGELALAGTAAIVRCRYCSADNLVSSKGLAHRTRAEALVLDGFENVVRGEASIAHRSAARGIVLLPVFALGSLLGVCVVWIAAMVAVVSIEGDVTTNELGLVWVDAPGHGRCIMRVAEERGAASIARWGFGDRMEYPIREPREPVDVRALTGTTLVHYRREPLTNERIVVELVYSSPFFPDSVYVRAHDGSGHSYRIEVLSGLCRPP